MLMHGPIDDVYRQIQGNLFILARFGRNLDLGLSIIRSNPDVSDVQVDGDRISIEFSSPKHDSGALLKRLVGADVEVLSFAEKEPTLEDVFMLVTKGLVS